MLMSTEVNGNTVEAIIETEVDVTVLSCGHRENS